MTVIDPSTDLGKLRLRVADYGDIQYLPDSVYLQTLQDKNNNLYESAKTCAMYILGMLSFKTHRKLQQLEIWGGEAFTHYKEFLMLTVKDPAFMDISPLPYSAASDCPSPILLFQESWNRNFCAGTSDQQLNLNALYSPNEGGPYGNFPIYSSEGY